MLTIRNISLCLALLAGLSSPLKAQGAQWDYECSFDGERHPHEIACHIYYECRVSGAAGGWTIYLYKCPENFHYNGDINSCAVGSCQVPVTTPEPVLTTEEEPELTTEEEPEPTTEEEPVATTEEEPEPTTEEEPVATTEEEPEPTTEAEPEFTTEEEPELTTEAEPELTTEEEPEPTTEAEPEFTTEEEEPEVTTEEEPATPGPFVCTKSGYFTDTEDCTAFHHCVCDGTGCADYVYQCPVNYFFCEDVQACATSEFCSCAAYDLFQ